MNRDALTSIRIAKLRQFYVERLAHLYSIENKILETLPRVKAISMRRTLEQHLEGTRLQVARLREILRGLAAPIALTGHRPRSRRLQLFQLGTYEA